MTENKEIMVKLFAGVFFVVGIAVFSFFVLTIGKSKGLAQPKFDMTVLYKDVGGLIEGAPVRLSGVNVGTVASIDFLEEKFDSRRVKVVLSIFSRFKNQFKGTPICAIRTEGVLGEKLIEISFVGNEDSTVDFSQPIIGIDPINVQDLAESFAGAAKSFTNTAEQLSEIDIVEFSLIMQQSAESLLKTTEGMNTILGDLDLIMHKSKRLLDRVEQKVINNELFKVF